MFLDSKLFEHMLENDILIYFVHMLLSLLESLLYLGVYLLLLKLCCWNMLLEQPDTCKKHMADNHGPCFYQVLLQ